MAKKDFSKTITGVDAFFSTATPAEPSVQEDIKPISEPVPSAHVEEIQTITSTETHTPARHGRSTYVFTLHLPKEWKDILADAAWERRMSVTGLLVEIIGNWLKAQKKI